MKSIYASILLLCALSISLTGCGGGGPDTPALGSVNGTVTLDGQPLAEVMVMFQPKAGGRASMGKTDSGGQYTLNFNSETPGAIIGDHTVSIRTPMENPDPNKKETIPAVYNRKSMLLEKVNTGENKIDFELRSKPFAKK